MLRVVHTVGIASAVALSGSVVAQSAIQYDFGIRVVENQVIDNGVGGALSSLEVGTVGDLSFLVSTDRSSFPADAPNQIQFYQILDLSIDIGSISSGAQQGAYPSATFFDGIGIENNAPFSNGLVDRIACLTKFDSSDLGFSVFTLVQRELGGDEPTLLSGTDLPLAIDTSLANTVDFTIASPLDGGLSKVVFDVFRVEVTPVPAPPVAALLGAAGLMGSRRRRS